MEAERRVPRAMLFACALACAALIGPAGASAQVVNQAGVNNGGVTQTTWLESFATVGESSSPANTLRISMIVQHPVGREVTGLRIDDDWDGTNEASSAAIKSVSAQQPAVSGGFGYSRVTYSYVIPTSGTDMSCGVFSGTRRTDNNSVHVRARMDDGTETATTSSRIKFIAAGQCSGAQDFGSIRSWGANNFNQSIQPGDSINLSYVCDDPDIDFLTSDDECGGVRYRRRNLMTGAVSATATDCVDGGDNTTKNTSVTFPDRGRWVVEAETLEEDCDTSSGSYWFPIGAADVNSAAAPSISLSATRPNFNGNSTVTANLGSDADSGDGGRPEYVEWDLDNNGSFETTTLGDTLTGLTTGGGGGAPQKAVDTTGMTPGLKTVRARVTDNGAMGGADDIRRTSGVATTTFLVDTPPVADAQTVGTESSDNKAITLTSSDADGDAVTYSIVDPPDHGTISGGTGPGRTYDPDGDFAGTDTFTFRATDSFGGQSAPATVTIDVSPQTAITSQPDPISGTADASFSFNTPVTSPPSAATPTFECRIDSTLETDFAPCTSPRLYTGLTDGSHTFHVRARQGTYVDPTPAAYTWTLDSTAPETSIDAAPPSPTSSSSASFSFSSNDPGASFECRLDGEPPGGSGWQSCTSPQAYTGLAEGSHSFEVRATDAFNRTDPIPASHTWSVDLTAPTVTIDDAPDDPTNATTADFEFSSSDPTASFECKLDAGSFAPCTSPASFSGLGQGAHSFSVRASDPAGNTGPATSFDWDIDTTVPETAIDSAPPASSDSAVASFEFSSPDPSAGFECRLDSSDPGDWEQCSSPQLFADLSDGAHALEVRATDEAGNKDASPATHAWSVDTTPPQTTIDSAPANPSGSAAADFEFSADEPGSSFECKLDAGAWGPCASPEQLTGLGEGGHVFRVRATDALGNTDPTPATRSWAIDLSGPVTTIEDGPADPSSSGAASIGFSADEPADFECRLDSSEEADFESCSSPVGLSGLGDGPHSLEVRATDQVGNQGATVSHDWTVDTVAPDAQITTGMPPSTSSAAASFEFTSGDGTASFQCRLDGGPWNACSSPKVYGGLDDGDHSFDVRARDDAGNTGAPDSDSWTVVNSGPPNTQIDSAPAATTFSTDAALEFSASEPSDFECRLDGGAFEACGSGTSGERSYSGLGLGAHSFQVRATDGDGNVDPTPATRGWTIIAVPSSGGGVAGAAAKSPVIKPGKRPLKRGKGTGATIECPSGPCTVTRRKAKVKLGGVSYRAKVKVPASIAEGATVRVKVKLKGSARRALAAERAGRLTLKLTVSSVGGTVARKIKLKVRK